MLRHLPLLLFTLFTLGCSPLELPPSDDNSHENVTTDNNSDDKVDGEGAGAEDKPDDNGENKSDDNGDAEDNGSGNNNANGDENQNADGSSDQQTPDLHFGRTSLTSDGHLLIDDKLYLSVFEYRDVSSAKGNYPTEAGGYAANYHEGPLQGWRIPTTDDVRILRDALACESPYYGDGDLRPLNDALTSRDLTPIYRELYLCEGATLCYTFDFQEQFRTTSKSKKYRLRLVRDK